MHCITLLYVTEGGTCIWSAVAIFDHWLCRDSCLFTMAVSWMLAASLEQYQPTGVWWLLHLGSTFTTRSSMVVFQSLFR